MTLMQLRKDLEPDFETAEKRYPAVLKILRDYETLCEEHGDSDGGFIKYTILDEKLEALTGKKMPSIHLYAFHHYEWWEDEGALFLSFRIALPNPKKVDFIDKEELLEIIRRIEEPFQSSKDDPANEFKTTFAQNLTDYYHSLLSLNFKNYKMEYFHSQPGNDGSCFGYSTEDKARKIMGI